MKRFKLLQWYPSLKDYFEEGDVVECIGRFKEYAKEGDNITIPREDVENNPEYWEKVIEKEYEIQSFRRTDGDRAIFSVLPDGTYWWERGSQTGEGISLEDMLYTGSSVKNGDFEIYSVKRLSDGKVFTLGDDTNKGVIKSFEHYEEKCHCKAFSGLYDVYTGDINKLKHPLFTTEDDVDIYEGDEFWYVKDSYDSVGHVYDAYKNVTLKNNKTYFSTKEKADKYLKENRKAYKVLSIKERHGMQRTLRVEDFDLTTGAYIESYEGADKFNSEKDRIEYILESFNIYSVKRLSDGEVFTIGDTVEFFHGASKITGFVIDDLWMGDMVVNGERDNESIAITSVYHVDPEPIFTTDDGVDIYEGDIFYEVTEDGVHKVELEDTSTEDLYETFLELKELDGRKAFGFIENASSHYYHNTQEHKEKLKFTGSEIVEVLTYFGIGEYTAENILKELVIRKR